jgi:hypothetical protein
MHSVLNATGDTFTSPRYVIGNPLIVSAGGLVAAAILFVVVMVGGVIRYRGRMFLRWTTRTGQGGGG